MYPRKAPKLSIELQRKLSATTDKKLRTNQIDMDIDLITPPPPPSSPDHSGNPDCICDRKETTLFCSQCMKFSFGRIRRICPEHPNVSKIDFYFIV